MLFRLSFAYGEFMHRHIVHIDMDAFFVSVERSRDPSLIGKPVVVGAADGTRGVVTSASYEARKYGIHSAMPIVQARRLCPQALFVPGSLGVYSKISLAIKEIFESWSPVVQMASIDEAYIDLTGFDRCYGPVMSTVEKIVDQVRKTLGLDLSAGIATNKLVAKIASKMAKPAGMLHVLPGCEEGFMAPLPLKEVPGIGDSLAKSLHALGLQTVGELRNFDSAVLVKMFGVTGEWLYRVARGKGSLHVETERQQVKSIGNSITFSEDSINTRFLEGALYHLSEKVGRRTRQKDLIGRTVTLRLRYADFKTLTRAVSVGEGTNWDMEIFEQARRLMQPLLERRVRVRLLGVTLSKLRPADGQLTLFDPEAQKKQMQLYHSVDKLRDKYGFEAVRKGPAVSFDSFRKPPEDITNKAV
jgi:DNA polymerase IV